METKRSTHCNDTLTAHFCSGGLRAVHQLIAAEDLTTAGGPFHISASAMQTQQRYRSLASLLPRLDFACLRALNCGCSAQRKFNYAGFYLY